MDNFSKVILASASPRRRELLAMLFADFSVEPSAGDETTTMTEPPAIVRELARRKAEDVASRADAGSLVIGADTIVVTATGDILGKPKDADDARRMLRKLSGARHSVWTGVALICGGREACAAERTYVDFCEMTDSEIDGYIASGDPMDKAGAYGIQGGAAKFIKGIDGCYYNVMGLPVHRLYEMIKEL